MKFVPEAWVRAGRSLVQNLLSVALVAGGPAIVVASQGGAADMGALGLAGGQAGLAAVLAYIHNRIRPVTGPKLGEVTARAGRTWWQNVAAAAFVSGAAAVATTGGDDLKTLGMAGLQAAAAGAIALLHNTFAPRKVDDGEVVPVSGVTGSVPDDTLNGLPGGPDRVTVYEPGSEGEGHGRR
ncbi:hypothetical protein ACFWYW_56820 [Nonomuraea sp. NPDC059023]